VSCQLFDNFDDGDLTTNPTWFGDVGNFVRDEEGALRLKAPKEGKSFIYTNLSLPDSFEFSILHGIDFSPSASNLSKIYLILDNVDLTKANGYYLNFGENGSLDAIKLYRLDRGAATLLASGVNGNIAKNLNLIEILLTYRQGKWNLKAKYDGSGSLTTEFDFIQNIPAITTQRYFGIECIYTSTRTDKFSFDNLSIKEYRPDTSPPQLSRALVLEPTKVLVQFSEEINTSSFIASAIAFEPQVGTISSILPAGGYINGFIISLNNPLENSKFYTLKLFNIKDLIGNNAPSLVSNQLRFVPKVASEDVILSEILFNPYPEAEDFIELYNKRTFAINLNGLIIKNNSKKESKTVLTDIIIEGNSYLAISKNIAKIKSIYQPPSNSIVITNDLPSFNDDKGNVAIYTNANILLDSFDYDQSIHNRLLADKEGVSLEKVGLNLSSTSKNWASGSKSTNYATPGYINNNQITAIAPEGDEIFNLENKSFSPNQDGNQDVLRILYKLPASGYVASIKVFDANGYFIKEIANNELLGVEGFLVWDGTDKNGQISRIGNYLLIGSVYSLKGDVVKLNKICTLAQKLD
jgi:hypothetical protein